MVVASIIPKWKNKKETTKSWDSLTWISQEFNPLNNVVAGSLIPVKPFMKYSVQDSTGPLCSKVESKEPDLVTAQVLRIKSTALLKEKDTNFSWNQKAGI